MTILQFSANMGATLSADLATLFDVGGIAGAVIAGVISDKSEMPATTCAGMLVLAPPMVCHAINTMFFVTTTLYFSF